MVTSTSADAKKVGTNPGPLEELLFWERKAENLQCIYEQLCDDKLRKIGRVLDITRSSYFPAFEALYDEVRAALTETNDIHRCLAPLKRYFVNMNSVSYNNAGALVSIFKPMIHTLALVWKESQFYTIPHLVLLVKEICNNIISILAGAGFFFFFFFFFFFLVRQASHEEPVHVSIDFHRFVSHLPFLYFIPRFSQPRRNRERPGDSGRVEAEPGTQPPLDGDPRAGRLQGLLLPVQAPDLEHDAGARVEL